MKHTDDEKLLMIYFNEAEQQDVDDCLRSAAACEQLDQLEADMNAIEHAQNQHELPDDYGQQLWSQIADRLEPDQQVVKHKTSHWLAQIKNMFLVPQYSLASFVVVLGLVGLAFMAGRQQSDEVFNNQLQEQLLAQNIQLHLTQSEIFLTQVSNQNGINNQMTAQRLLSSNRIFKRALVNHEGQFTSQLLNDLEPILLEYANGAPAQTNQPQANWVRNTQPNDLMFQIKALKQQLAQENDII